MGFRVILHVFCHLLICFKINFFENFFQEYQKRVKVDPDQARHVGPDLGPNCLQMLSAADTCTQY